MISPELLEILRCPLDPSHTRLSLEAEQLVCQRCRLQFKIKDGFPILVVDEAELPAGCDSIDQLPCQREKNETRGPGAAQAFAKE
jgi:uncharacterized protein YbaR (Trm112 family)